MVIGGTHGIGLAIAEELVRGGGEVVVTGRDAGTARAAEDRLGAAGTAIAGDVTDGQHLASLAGQAGDLDALFVNVGIAEPEPVAEVTEASWDRQFDVNAKGAFFAAQHLAPRVRSGGGVVLTTLMAKTASADEAVYAATKAAVRAFSRSLAADQVRRGVRVNTVAPGFIDTPTLGVAGASASERADLQRSGRALTPMGRLGTPAEVARAAMFLAFEATFTTGSELQVDGGLSQIEVPA
jgi:NAD(P)-dependent dehydrogenase (short-subunit alcohol dehydrogenase family)